MRTTLITLILTAAGTAFAQAPAVDGDGEVAMLARINALRAEQELAPLRRHQGLDAVARGHSIDMATYRELVHVSARTGDPARRVREAGVATTRIAENIARHITTEGALDSIFASDAHRAQLLDPTFTHIGLAAVSGSDGMYITQVTAALAGPPPIALPPPAVASTDITAEPETVNPVAEIPLPEPPSAEPTQEAAQLAAVPPTAVPQTAVPPTMRLPHTRRPVAGYWVQQSGRWWYFPVPGGAIPGQLLQADLTVQGPPPNYRAPQQVRRPRVLSAQPPPVRYRTQPSRQTQQQRRVIYWY